MVRILHFPNGETHRQHVLTLRAAARVRRTALGVLNGINDAHRRFNEIAESVMTAGNLTQEEVNEQIERARSRYSKILTFCKNSSIYIHMSSFGGDGISEGVRHFIHRLDVEARRQRQGGLRATFRTAGGGEKGQAEAASAANLRRQSPKLPQVIHL